MNYKGKIVTVEFYHHWVMEKPYRTITGKVLNIHTARGIKDTSTITIKDSEGKKHSGDVDGYFVIREVKP